VYSAGLMLTWICDLIVGADDVSFADVFGTRFGICGMEYFALPWELGARKTIELMLTGDSIDVHEAHAPGMVSRVFPAAELSERTLEFARRVAQVPTMAAHLIRESVNQTQKSQRFSTSLNACSTLHDLNDAHWAEINEDTFPIAKEDSGVPNWRDAPPIVPSVKDMVRADAPA
jgi:enoyl-CoA hydratase